MIPCMIPCIRYLVPCIALPINLMIIRYLFPFTTLPFNLMIIRYLFSFTTLPFNQMIIRYLFPFTTLPFNQMIIRYLFSFTTLPFNQMIPCIRYLLPFRYSCELYPANSGPDPYLPERSNHILWNGRHGCPCPRLYTAQWVRAKPRGAGRGHRLLVQWGLSTGQWSVCRSGWGRHAEGKSIQLHELGGQGQISPDTGSGKSTPV